MSFTSSNTTKSTFPILDMMLQMQRIGLQAMTMYPYVDREIRRQAAAAGTGPGAAVLRAAHSAADEEARRAARAAVDELAIREAQPRDMPALLRLADLDSRPLPGGTLLVAEVGGRIRAALSVDDGQVIADPFMRTASLQDLLRLRAEQVAREHHSARRRGLLAALHLRTKRAG